MGMVCAETAKIGIRFDCVFGNVVSAGPAAAGDGNISLKQIPILGPATREDARSKWSAPGLTRKGTCQ